MRRGEGRGGVVLGVSPGGPAERSGLRPGDRALAVNGLVPRDIVDVRLDAAGPSVELDVERDGSRLVLAVEKEWDEDLGIEFERADFDRLKTCNNRCEFCFISGLPPGLRRTLYIKDDDFRYSFLYGSFVTLTNLSAAEWGRLIFQRLSPLRVSVHATDADLRRELLGNPAAPAILDQLDELGLHSIRVHAQIVLMPGRNDGPTLERTLADLVARYPTVESAAVVPVGLTAHSSVAHVRAVTPEDAAAAVDIVDATQRRCRRALGCGVAYASDELYLLSGRGLPSARSYDGYLQLHNGVGLVRLFRDEWKRAARRLPREVDPSRSVCWGTGALMEPVLRELAADLHQVDGLTVDVVPIQNSLFGGQVTVAGLLPARDVIAAMAGKRYDRLVLSRSMLDAQGQQTIDGWSLDRIRETLAMDVAVAVGPRDLIERTLCAAS